MEDIKRYPKKRLLELRDARLERLEQEDKETKRLQEEAERKANREAARDRIMLPK